MDSPVPPADSNTPATAKPPEDAWRRAIRHQILRAPCLLPCAAAVGAAMGGQWWMLPLAALACAYMLGRWRVLLMCLLCSMFILLRNTQQERCTRDFLALLERDSHAMVEGIVVRTMARGCVVDAGWNKPAVLLRGETPYRCGDVVRVMGCARPTSAPLCPGMFDAARWMKGQGIAAELDFIRGEVLGHPFSWAAVQGRALQWREALEKNLMPDGTEADARRQLLCALVLGDKRFADPELILDFQRGGCLHVFAVSGLHVGLVAGFLWLLARYLRLSPAWGRVVLVLVTGAYVMLTGLAVPALRAYLMLVLVLGGTALKRKAGLVNIWCFACTLLLLLEPWQIGQSSFLLSFAVYAAICFGVRLCFKDRPWFGPDEYIPFRIMTPGELRVKAIEWWVRGIVVVAVSAWVASLPLSMGLFHAFNLYGIFTNIVISPLLPLVMGAGLLCLCSGGVPLVGGVVAAVAVRLAGYLLATVSFFAALPCSYLPVQVPRAPHEALVVPLGYDNSACMLGNPGLLIDCGSEASARYTLQPLLFHMGFTPSALLETRPLDSRQGGRGIMTACWPRMQCLPVGRSASPVSLQTRSGLFRLHYPPADLPQRPAANAAPVVTWQSPQGLVVHVGDASLATLERVDEDLSKAVVVILGNNPGQSVDATSVVNRMPSARVVLLPSAVLADVKPEGFAPLPVTCVPEREPLPVFTAAGQDMPVERKP